MSKAIEYFSQNAFMIYSLSDSYDKKLEQKDITEKSAKLFLEEKQYLNAGIVLYYLVDNVWGMRNSNILFEVCNRAIESFETVLSEDKSSNEEIMLSYNFIIDILCRIIPLLNSNKREISEFLFLMQNKLGQFIFDNYKDHTDKKIYLVTGFKIEGSIESCWDIILPTQETTILKKGGGSSYSISSSFNCFLSSNDYFSALKIVKLDESFFDSNYLYGWMNAIKGITNPNDEVKCFEEAFKAFSRDYKEGWINPGDLWKKYFKSRYHLSLGLQDKNNFKGCLIESLESLGEMRSGLINYQILKYKYLLETFVAFFILKDSREIDKSQLKLEKEIRNSYLSSFDLIALDFINNLGILTKEIENDPDNAIFRISDFKDIISKFPLFASNLDNSKSLVGKGFHQFLNGKTAWIYRALQSIKSDETPLQKIILRLYQAKLPQFTQRVHGNFENGRDLFLLPKDKDELQVIQVKLGDIKISDWRKIKPQLEEMMETEIPHTLSKEKIKKKIGILLFTGHINPNVDSVINDWKIKRKEKLDEDYDFINIDKLVTFITDNGLISEFRLASLENGIKLEI